MVGVSGARRTAARPLLGVPPTGGSENAHFFPRCAGDLQRPLFITPTYTPEKSSYTLSADPLEPCTKPGKSCYKLRARFESSGSILPVLRLTQEYTV